MHPIVSLLACMDIRVIPFQRVDQEDVFNIFETLRTHATDRILYFDQIKSITCAQRNKSYVFNSSVDSESRESNEVTPTPCSVFSKGRRDRGSSTSVSTIDMDDDIKTELIEDYDNMDPQNIPANPYKLIKLKQNINELKDKLKELQNSEEKEDVRRIFNNISSRICRMKKSAVHEENNIKFKGLLIENKRLKYYIHKTKRQLQNVNGVTGEEKKYLLKKINMSLDDRVAGNLENFVRSVLQQSIDIQDNLEQN